jgi:hypothetical protein
MRCLEAHKTGLELKVEDHGLILGHIDFPFLTPFPLGNYGFIDTFFFLETHHLFKFSVFFEALKIWQ